MKFKTKTFKTTPDATHANIRDFTLLLIKVLYEEVEGVMSAELFDFYDGCETSESTQYMVYNNFLCVGNMKREDHGVVTRHGIVNSIHPWNDHAWACLKRQPILPNVPLFRDGRNGKFKNDYFFELTILDEDGELVGRNIFVLNSQRLTKLLTLYEKMKDETEPIPKQFTI